MSLQAIKQVKDAEAEAGKMVQDAQAESRRLNRQRPAGRP